MKFQSPVLFYKGFAWITSFLLFLIWRILITHENVKHDTIFGRYTGKRLLAHYGIYPLMTAIEKQLQLLVALSHWYCILLLYIMSLSLHIPYNIQQCSVVKNTLLELRYVSWNNLSRVFLKRGDELTILEALIYPKNANL